MKSNTELCLKALELTMESIGFVFWCNDKELKDPDKLYFIELFQKHIKTKDNEQLKRAVTRYIKEKGIKSFEGRNEIVKLILEWSNAGKN